MYTASVREAVRSVVRDMVMGSRGGVVTVSVRRVSAVLGLRGLAARMAVSRALRELVAEGLPATRTRHGKIIKYIIDVEAARQFFSTYRPAVHGRPGRAEGVEVVVA